MTIQVKDANNATQTVSTADDIIAKLPAALGTGGGLKVDGSGTAFPVSVADGSDAAEGASTGAGLDITA